jgi:hypothetical protein
MKRYLKYIVVAIIAVVSLSCAADSDVLMDPGNGNGVKPKPTTPIKRRPIVPTTRLPRPRVIESVSDNMAIGTNDDYNSVALDEV